MGGGCSRVLAGYSRGTHRVLKGYSRVPAQEANPNGRRLLGLAALAQLELEAAWRRRFGGHGVTLRDWGAEVRTALVGALVFAGGAADESDASVTRAGVQACTAGPSSHAAPHPVGIGPAVPA
jgi:hypothetical protein